MKRIGTKTLALFLCLTLVFSAALSASARASDYFSHTVSPPQNPARNLANQTQCGSHRGHAGTGGQRDHRIRKAIQRHLSGCIHLQVGQISHARHQKPQLLRHLCDLPRNPRQDLLRHRPLLRRQRQRVSVHLGRVLCRDCVTLPWRSSSSPFRVRNTAPENFFIFFVIGCKDWRCQDM